MYKFFRSLPLSLLLLLLTHQQAAATIVQLDISLGLQPSQAVYIELFDQGAPLTVVNFLGYVDARSYDNTFVHRLSRGFVVQLGGYIFDPAAGGFEGAGVSHILENDPVINEFSADRPNIRGTIAMAKLGNNPDSATSEWFFNLVDNTATLSEQNNGGFTVFGRVLGTGMDTVDEIANLAIQSRAFAALPVVNYTSGDEIAPANLVNLNQVIRNPPAAIAVDNINPDFGQVETGVGPASRVITIQNIGATDLVIGQIGNPDPLSSFSVSADNCSGWTLSSLDTCTITANFEPATPGDEQDSFNIPSNANNLPDLVVNLRGTGVSNTPVLKVTPSGTIVLPAVLTGETGSIDISVQNIGGGLLIPAPPSITGTGADAYSTINNCLDVLLALGETCTITVEISGNSEGDKTATIQIDADDGTQTLQTFQATLSGSVVPPEPDIDVTSLINVGDALIGEVLNSGFGIRNPGKDRLTITGIEIFGADASLFTLGNICVKVTAPGFGCGETLVFNPVQAMDSVDATVRIYSDDPDTPVLEIPVQASASGDRDGITDAIENRGPNGGDGNNDGVPDSVQTHITSLPNIYGEYVTLEVAAGQTLVDMTAIESPSPDDTPTISRSATLDFNQGFFTFAIDNVPAGGSATVTIYLPKNSSATHYFKYGTTRERPFFHWYEFSFDGETGAEFFADRVVLHFIDGGRGDSDLDATNGRIVDPGGPASLSIAGSSSGGGGGGCSLRANENQYRASALPADFIALTAGVLLILLYRSGRRYPYASRRNDTKS